MSTAQTPSFDSAVQWCILTYLLLFSPPYIDFLPLLLKACLRVLVESCHPHILLHTHKEVKYV